jgi:hypothetical protein
MAERQRISEIEGLCKRYDLSDELRDVEESIAAWNDMVAMAEKRRAKIKERLTSLGVVGDLT